MSIGPMNPLAASIAGSPVAQTSGSEVEVARRAANSQQMLAQNDLQAENAAGVGTTDGEEHEASDRDADGRRLWEIGPRGRRRSAIDDPPPAHPSKDVTGEAGHMLDLSG